MQEMGDWRYNTNRTRSCELKQQSQIHREKCLKIFFIENFQNGGQVTSRKKYLKTKTKFSSPNSI